LLIRELQEQLACGASTLATFKEHRYEVALAVGVLKRKWTFEEEHGGGGNIGKM
jgi:hypothetical protein